MDDFFNIILSNEFIVSVLRLSTPILFAALGALISNKAGVVNIGLEGIMLFSALFGVLGSFWTGDLFTGGLIGVLIGALVSALLAFSTLYLKSDIILTGVVINLIGAGGTIFFLEVFTGDKNVSTSIVSQVFPNIDFPAISNVPFIGGLLSGHNVLTWVAIALAILLWFVINKTHFGLKLRAVGENPAAASSLGISVRKHKFVAIVLSGVLASVGGIFLSMGYVSFFAANMTAGRGFIALAAEAMAMGNPILTMLSSLLFGFMSAIAIAFGSSGFLAIFNEIFEMLPYVATILALIIYAIIAKQRIKILEVKNGKSLGKGIQDDVQRRSSRFRRR